MHRGTCGFVISLITDPEVWFATQLLDCKMRWKYLKDEYPSHPCYRNMSSRNEDALDHIPLE